MEGTLQWIADSRPRYLLTLAGLTIAYVIGMPCIYLILGVSRAMSPSLVNLLTHVLAWSFIAGNGWLIYSRLSRVTLLGMVSRVIIAYGLAPVVGLLLTVVGHGHGTARLIMFVLFLLGIHLVTLAARPRSGTVAAAAVVSVGRVRPPASIPTIDETPVGATVRKGWQLPQQQVSMREAPHPPTPTDASARLPTMPGAVFGQVRNMEQSTISRNQISEPIVTLRLERNDPHAGLNAVAIVRLEGNMSSGFAGIGDWVEAIGRKKSAYLVASRCINHTTGGVYDNAIRELSTLARRVFVALFIVVWLGFAGTIFSHF